jgi:membrane peptidoglycan carboxypeptidase
MTMHPRNVSGWKSRRFRRLFHFRIPRVKVSKPLIKNLVLGALALAMAGSLGVLALFAYVSRDLPNPDALTERIVPQSTKIYDRTGEHLLYEIHGEENRTLVKLQEGYCKDDDDLDVDPNGIPLQLLEAVVTAEDRGFCEHHGFSITGLLRAVAFAGKRGGGSTLTQQLVSNTIIAKEHTIVRKIRELILSIELERRYSKDEILQIYFNEIGYGSTYYGVQTAATSYYGKPVNELSLAQLATLAGLPQRPTTFLNNPDLLKERRDWILDGMAEMGFVSKDEAVAAKAEDTSIAVNISNITAPHFVFYVRDLLEQKYSPRQVEEGGLKVITSLDYEKQVIAEEEVKKGVEEKGEYYQFTNASLVAVDPKTGQVLAMVGSKDYFDDDIDGQVNVSLRPRQPGSSFKPIVYTKAFASGYTPNTVLWDVKTDFPTATGIYSPNDYDLKERGPIRARNALQGSLNIPAVEMLYMVGVDNALDFATELGYTTFTDRSNFGLAIVLGGAEVTLLDHANAYATFANEGERHDPVAILKVEDSDGTVLEEWKEQEGKRVLEQNVARTISNVLSDNGARAYVFGAGSALQLGSRPVAAKTGTTNDYHDAWTMGYTPSIAAGVWVGNNDNAEMLRGADGSIVAAPIWNGFMSRVLEGTPIEYFTAPQIPQTGKPILDGQIPATTVTVDRVSGKLATEYTPTADREERTYAEYHSLLQYVDRSDPLGPAPADPTQDPYYEPWEKGIADWIARREEETGIKITQSTPPTEYDDVHVLENFPTVRITGPDEGTSYTDRRISVDANADAKRGVVRVDFYIDGYFLGSDSRSPYQLSTTIPGSVSRGYHTVKAVAYDDVDNSGSDTVGIQVDSDATSSGFDLLDPKNGQTIERTNETYSIVVSAQHPTDYQTVTIYAQPLGSGSQTIVGSKTSPDSPFLTFAWTLPDSGDWVITASALGSSGTDATSVVVHVVPPSTTAQPPVEPTAEEPGADGEEVPLPEEPTVDLPPLDPFATTTPPETP